MSYFKPKIGLDLGSNEIVIYLDGKGLVLQEPTIVAVSNVDRKIIAFGYEAREMLGKTPESISAVKPIKNGVIHDYKIAVKMISFFMNKTLGKYSLFKPEIIVSVPSSVSGTEKRALIEAVMESGAKDVYTVKEPVLAAIGSGVPIQEPVGRMIMNIGGGTTDIAVVSLGGVVFSKSVKVGGNKMDESIINMVREKHNCIIGERSAEMIKCAIGSAILHKEEKGVKVKGRDFQDGQPIEVTVHKSEIVKALNPDLQSIVACAQEVFAETPPELASDIMDNGILLSGGGANLPDICEFLEKELNIPAQVVEDPKLCVANGLGLILNHVDFYKRALVSKNSL